MNFPLIQVGVLVFAARYRRVDKQSYTHTDIDTVYRIYISYSGSAELSSTVVGLMRHRRLNAQNPLSSPQTSKFVVVVLAVIVVVVAVVALRV